MDFTRFHRHHTCNAIAPEGSEVREIPFNRLEQLSRENPASQRHLHKIMSREIVRDQGIMHSFWEHESRGTLAAILD